MTDFDAPIMPYEPQTGPAKLVRIGPFRDLIEANLASGRLNDEGIRASLAGENLAATLGPIYGAAYAGGPVVLVPAEDEAAARAIVADIERVRSARNAALAPACPRCEHRPTNPVLHGTRWAGLGLMLVSIFLVAPFDQAAGLIGCAIGIMLLVSPHRPAWKCPACGNRFTADKPVVADADEDDAETDPAN